MSAQPATRITPEQYLEMEERASFRSEYYFGCAYAMAGGTYAHALILLNFGSELRRSLKAKNCTATPSEVKLEISLQQYVYPDLMVICGEPEFADGRKDTIRNPTVIVEVLSESTEASDRGYKFSQYRKLPSLREYVLVSQLQPHVERFSRSEGDQWTLKDADGLDSVVRLDSLDCEIRLTEIYDKVKLPEPQAIIRPSHG